MNYSLRHPPAGLSGFLRLIWPLIFVQLVALKRWVRTHYGPGVPYGYGITKWGRVFLRHLPAEFTSNCAALRPVTLAIQRFKPSVRLAGALAAETCDVPAPGRDVAAISVHTLSDIAHADTS